MRWERVRRQNQQVGLGDSSSGPGKRWGHTCNAIKGGRFVYVFGGFGRDDCLTNQVHVFDAGTQIWTKPVIRGVPPSPRDSHSCTTVGDHLFVFGGTDGKNHLNDLHVLDTSSHTWKCVDARGEGPEAREAHSATLVGKRIFIFGGCGKASGSDDEVFYNDLYILNTETLTWQRAVTTGNPPSARDSHTCSTWKNKIIVVGGEDLDDYYLSDVHILDTETFVWKQMKTSGQVLTPRAGHVTVPIERTLFVFGGFTDSQNLYDDLYVLDVETGVWSKLVAMEEGPAARFSAGAVCLGPYKAGSFFFLGGCNKSLEPLDDIYYLHTDGGYNARFDQTPGRLSLRKQMKLKCQAQKLAVAGTSTNQGRENLPLSIGSMYQGKTVFQARVTENVPLGYSIETIIDGKVLRGFLFSNRQSSGLTVDPSVSSGRKRPAMSDADCDHGAKSQRILSEDAAGSSQQAGPVDPSDDANKKVADSDDIHTSMIDTADANVNIARPQEAETAAVAADVKSDVKDQDPSQLNMDAVNAETSPVTLDQANAEPLRNETTTDVGAATEAGPGGDSSPQNQDDGTIAVEDAQADQKPQPH
ncbi:tip elongation aberrant protein 1 isoform X1 [Brassica napus]|uniref:tip elongation aberrant protein 1 isoform X1 n=1 Tax=Brassica napus TaxID=3708 RepID=UPI00207AA6EB|nr:tip elongation aberrant protein 1 isoform X1 [Brassica napus]